MAPPRGPRADPVSSPAPTTIGAIARLAIAQLLANDVDPEPLLVEAGLSPSLQSSPDERIPVRRQVAFLNLAADALEDDLLGFHLALGCDVRALGLVHYMMASADTLAEALKQQEHYGRTTNEAMRIRDGRTTGCSVELLYAGVERHFDRHQAEFWLTCTLRQCRLITGRELVPVAATLVHPRPGRIAEMERFFGLKVDFGAERDLLAFDRDAGDMPLATSDPFLKDLLAGLYARAFPAAVGEADFLRVRVENAIAPRLRHGTPTIDAVARDLGTSARTLTRRLAASGASFSVILDELRYHLAVQYLRDGTGTISEIAWLLGYREPSASVRAFKRWTGKTPTEFRRELRGRATA